MLLTLEIGIRDEGKISFLHSIFKKCGSISFPQRVRMKNPLFMYEVPNGFSGPKPGTLVIKLRLRGAHEGSTRGMQEFPGGPVVKNLPASARDMFLTPGPGRPHMLQSN